MSEYSVTLYIGNHASRYKLDDLIHRSFNGYLNRDISCAEQKMYCPIVKEDEGYYLEPDYRTWTFRINGGSPAWQGMSRIPLKHGDYLQADQEGYGYSALFLEDCRQSLSAVFYAVDFSSLVFIGRGDDMNVIIRSSGSVSRKHAVLHRETEGVFVEDLSGKTGVFVNGVRENSRRLRVGDEISIGGIAIVYVGKGIVVPSFVETRALQRLDALDVLERETNALEGRNEYIRTPRIYKSLEEGTIEIDPPTAPHKAKEVPFILSVGPSLTMSLAMLVSLGVTISGALQGGNGSSAITGSVMTASMLAGALLWPRLLKNYNEKQRAADERHRQSRYLAYLAEIEREINQLYERNTRIWNDSFYPAPQNLLSMARRQDRRLWERTPEDSDFLSVRLGVGERPFEISIQSRKKGFVLDADEMADRASEIISKYSTLKNVPMTLSLLDKRTVGVIGQTHDVAKSILFNLAFFHASDEVKIVMVYNHFQAAEYGALSALPHAWSNDRSRRYAATTRAEAHALFSMLDEEIQRREAQLERDEGRIPHYVVMVFDSWLVEDIPFKRYLLDCDNNVGVSTVFFAERFNAIPKECSAIVQKEESYCGVYFKNENQNRFLHYLPDPISEDDYSAFVSSIAQPNTRTGSREDRIPDRVSFLDAYQVGNIAGLGILNRWNTNASDRSLAAIIGVRAGNEAFSLDIHERYHGCHGLVAGTTGSGKSEFLQAYILSMMINFSPNEVSFVLIDFKGGDMARPFLKAPHLAATISNLSENTLHRALVSLEAEVKSRQRTMNAAAQALGVDKLDINSYHRYFKERRIQQPLPHLILVIDEFAQLKSQHPEFMTKLIGIAQVGRSLGIHLILATQKPSGVVDPQIWSNSRFRVCLKVTDKQDSLDMLNHPDAARIKLPGRAYVQIGYDEIFEQIQSGYSGADYVPKDEYLDEESTMVSLINAPGERLRSVREAPVNRFGSRRTQLEEIVAEICSLGLKQGLRSRELWLPQLPDAMRYEDCDAQYAEWNPERCDVLPPGRAICGMMDLPAQQVQIPYSIDFLADGHLAVYGSSGSGTSTFIQTLAYALALRYSPEWFNLLVMDFDGGSLMSLSNMPHCVGYASGENERDIEQTLNHLQAMIGERRVLFAEHSCASYESYIASTRSRLPVVLMALDNYAVFRESMYKQEDKLIRLLAAAKSCGIYAVITGNSKSAIYYRVMDHMAKRIVFSMNDSGAYRDLLNVQTPVKPDGTKGRALALYEGKAVEVQIAVPFECESEAERNRHMAACYVRMKRAYGGHVSMRSLKPEAEDSPLEIHELAADPAERLTPLPSVSSMVRPILLGTNAQTGMACGFETAGCQRILLANPGNREIFKSLMERAAETGASVYVISKQKQELPDSVHWVEDLDEFVFEHFTGEGETDGIYLIDGFADFYDRISTEALERLQAFLRQGRDGCFITADAMDKRHVCDGYSSTEAYLHLIRANCGIVVGGGVSNELSAMLHSRFNELPIAARARKLGQNQGFAYSGVQGAYLNLRL